MAETHDIKEIAEKASDLAKNIWLAGLGAYGKALDEAQEQYEKVSGKVSEKVEKVKVKEDSTRFFDELVAKGKKLENSTQEKFTEVKEKASSNLEERLSQVKDSLSFTSKNSEISTKLDDIASKLDLLIEAAGSTKAAPKKPAVKKVASTAKAS